MADEPGSRTAKHRDRRTVSPRVVLALLFLTCGAMAYAIYSLIQAAR